MSKDKETKDTRDPSTLADIPEYVNNPNQVGNKIWRLVPGEGINVTKTTSSSVDTYTFEANISPEDGNVIEVKDDGLFVPEVTSKTEEIQLEINDLKDKLEKLKNTELRPTESVTLINKTDDSGLDYVQADVNISLSEGNSIEIKADGLYSRSMDTSPGSIADIERRLTKLENELKVINQDIDNLKTSALVDRSDNVTPPIVIPDSVK